MPDKQKSEIVYELAVLNPPIKAVQSPNLLNSRAL